MAKTSTPKLSADDLARLPADLRGELAKDGAEAETVRPSAIGKPTPAPKIGQRDETPVAVLVHAHNVPWGEVMTALEADEVPARDDKGKIPDEINKDGGVVRRFLELGGKVFAVELRRLQRKERVLMPRWCAELAASKDQVVVL